MQQRNHMAMHQRKERESANVLAVEMQSHFDSYTMAHRDQRDRKHQLRHTKVGAMAHSDVDPRKLYNATSTSPLLPGKQHTAAVPHNYTEASAT